MISEIDIRDWDFEKVRGAVAEVYSKTDYSALNALYFVESFIDRVEALVTMHQPQVAALFKPKEDNG